MYLEIRFVHAKKYTFLLRFGPPKFIQIFSLGTLQKLKVAHLEDGTVGFKFYFFVQGLHFAVFVTRLRCMSVHHLCTAISVVTHIKW